MPNSSTPPVLPEVKVERVVRLARADAVGVVVCSGLSLATSVMAEDWIFGGFSALALVCGVMEWHGQERLREGDSGGLQWLIGAQACLYTVILGYVIWRLQHFDPNRYWAEIPESAQEQLTTKMREAALDPVADREPLLRMMNLLVCGLLIGISTLYQVGLALWYRAQRNAVLLAFGNPSTPTDD